MSIVFTQRLSFILCLAALLCGCDSSRAAPSESIGSSAEALAVVTSLSVTPPTAAIPVSVQQQLKATAIKSNNNKKTLTTGVAWSVSNPTIASVTSEGLVTALQPGTVTVTATDTAANISGTASIVVTTATLSSLSVTPAAKKLPSIGTTATFTATGIFSDGTHWPLASVVSWTSSNSAVATIASTGVATAVAAGTVAMTATDTASGLSARATLTVGTATLSSIAITPGPSSIPNGLTEAFRATATYSNATTLDVTGAVTWSSSSTAVATISNDAGSVGVATAASVGATTITATLKTKKATSILTVTSAVLSSLAITPATASVPSGTTLQLTATGTYSNHTTANVTSEVLWASSSAGLEVSNADGSNGLATGLPPLGPATVTATLGSVSSTASFTVTSAVLQSISVTPPSPTVPLGVSQPFVAMGTYSDSTTQDITASVTWTTGSAQIATVSNSSTPPAGVATPAGVGSTTVSALDPMTGLVGSATINVTAATLVSLSVVPGSSSLPLGTAVQLTATGTYTDGSTQVLSSAASWTTSAPGIVSVTSSGSVTAVGLGSVTVTATDPSTGVNATASVSVTAATLVSVAVSPPNPSVPSGLTQQFTATGTYSDGSTQSLTASATWSSSAPSATISNAAGSQGLATAASSGVATIAAIDPTTLLSGSTTMTTASALLVSLAITPATPTLALGTTVGFTATGTFSDSSRSNVTLTETWASSAPAILAVSNAVGSNGLGSALSPGVVTVTATDPATGMTSTATATVAAAPSACSTLANGTPCGLGSVCAGGTCGCVVNACASHPCQNGGICLGTASSYTCTCENGYGGATCTQPPSSSYLAAVTVPFVPSETGIPHPVLSGVATTLKGIAVGPVTQFRWDFGDGSNSGWTNLGGSYSDENVGLTHTYVGNASQLFIAILTVQTATGTSASAIYPVQIQAPTAVPDPRIAVAVDEGLWFLHVSIARGTLPSGAPGYGLPYGTLGSISGGCAAAEAFERNGSTIEDATETDPYADDLRDLFNDTFISMSTTSASNTATTQDLNGNGLAVVFSSDDVTAEDSTACSQAFAAGLPLSYVIPAGPTNVYGRSLSCVSQDLTDGIASVQSPDGSWAGDSLSTFFATLALSDYQAGGAQVAPYVATRLARWASVTRDTTAGTDHCGGWDEFANGQGDLASTAGGLFEAQYLGTSTSSPSFQEGLGFLYREWGATNPCAIVDDSVAYYALSIALRATSTASLSNYSCAGALQTGASFNWFSGAADPYPAAMNAPGLATILVDSQTTAGYLTDQSWSDSSAGGLCTNLGIATPVSTGWAISALLGGGG